MKIMRGKAWVFGDNLDVDFEIVPFRRVRSLTEVPTLESIGQYCMTPIDPDFPKKMNTGDFIIAGENMGCGHDHVDGPLAIKGCGISAVIAESLHDWFFRNSVLIGLPVIQHKGIKKKVKQGDELELDYEVGRLTNLTTTETFSFRPLPPWLLEIMETGDLWSYVKKKIDTNSLDTYLE